MAEHTKAKAWTYERGGYPDCLQQSEIEPKAQLSPTEIQVRIHAAALNPVDIQVMNLFLWAFPTMGYEKGCGCDFSGTVLRSGAEVGGRYTIGSEVFGMMVNVGGPGTLAEVQTIDTAKAAVAAKPAGWSHEQAAALPLIWLTALTTIDRVVPYVSDGGTVAVLGGSSATGMYTVLKAKERGWRVISSCSGRNVDFVKSMGADEVVDYTQNSVADAVRAAKPDAIIDCVGGTECLGIAKRFVTIVGDKTSRLTIGGSMLYYFSLRMNLRWALGRLGFGEVYDCILLDQNNGWLEKCKELPKDKIFIDSEFTFDEVKQAYERLNTSRARGKVVVKIAS